jgi:hypothetical protein
MISCPECRWELDLGDLTVPEAGRLLACPRCSFIWRLMLSEEERRQQAERSAAPPPPPPPEAAPAVPVGAGRVARIRSGLVALLPKLRLAGLALVAVAALYVGLATMRNTLVVWVPSLRPLFTAFGLHVGPSAIAIRLVGVAPAASGNIRIEYAVLNDTALARPIPTICATGFDSSGDGLFTRCFPGETASIESKSERRFSFIIVDPVSPVAEVRLDMRAAAEVAKAGKSEGGGEKSEKKKH